MGVRLPAEYQEVEYLKSTGTQYIDLGLNSPMVNGCFSVKTMIDYDTPANTQFLGYNTDNSNKLPKVSIENNNFNLRQSGNKVIGSSLKGSIVVMTSDRNGNVYVNNVKRGTINTVSRTGNGYYLFNALPSYMQYAAKAKIYSFNVWDDEKQFIDLIPCYRKFDSKPGMYDLVSGTFFTNQGTGEFLVGPDVIDSISPWMVARRRGLMIPKVYGPNLISLSDFTKISGNATWSVDDETGIITVTGSTNYSAASTEYGFVRNKMIVGHTYEMHCKLVSATDISVARFTIRGKSENVDQIAYSAIPTAIGEEASVIFTVDQYMSYFSLFSKLTTGGSQTVAYSDVWVKEILR